MDFECDLFQVRFIPVKEMVRCMFFFLRETITYMYLVLVFSIWLESFVFVDSRSIPVNECFCVTSVGGRGLFQSAVHLIVQDYAVWLSRRRPGKQKGGLEASIIIWLEV